MKRYRIGWVAVGLVVAAALTGCWWKKASNDSPNLTSSATGGFDSLATTDELAQLPAPTQTGAVNQQGSVESLPVEISPVTPAASASVASTDPAPATTTGSDETLSHNRQIQTALKSAGVYQGNIDGKIGPASRKAIQTFQKNNGLKADGKVGPKTWAALESHLNGSAGSQTASSTATTTQ